MSGVAILIPQLRTSAGWGYNCSFESCISRNIQVALHALGGCSRYPMVVWRASPCRRMVAWVYRVLPGQAAGSNERFD